MSNYRFDSPKSDFERTVHRILAKIDRESVDRREQILSDIQAVIYLTSMEHRDRQLIYDLKAKLRFYAIKDSGYGNQFGEYVPANQRAKRVY